MRSLILKYAAYFIGTLIAAGAGFALGAIIAMYTLVRIL